MREGRVRRRGGVGAKAPVTNGNCNSRGGEGGEGGSTGEE